MPRNAPRSGSLLAQYNQLIIQSDGSFLLFHSSALDILPVLINTAPLDPGHPEASDQRIGILYQEIALVFCSTNLNSLAVAVTTKRNRLTTKGDKTQLFPQYGQKNLKVFF